MKINLFARCQIENKLGNQNLGVLMKMDKQQFRWRLKKIEERL